MTLLLTTPDQHSFQDPTVELNEKNLRRWLSGLPVLNARDSLRLVLGALEPLNEQQLDVDKRLGLLSIYQATFNRLYATAEPVRLRQQPLSRQQRQGTVDDVERLSLAMANGFKLAVKALYAQGERRDKQTFGRVLRWALQALAAALLHSYRFYRPEPPFVFLEINQIYRLARHHGLHEVAASEDHETAQISLAGIYQAVCLLSLCDPFSLQEGVADNCYRALLQYVGAARVVPGNSWQGVPEGLFFVDLQSDSRPRHCVLLESPVAGDDPYIVDARGTLQQMHKALAAWPADRRRQRAETLILKALLPEVTPRDKRRSERRRDGRWIGLVTGLEPVADWLLACLRGESPQASEWRVKDASEQGYCLAWDESAASLLQVGDLVCVVSDSDEQAPQRLQLMVARWLRDARERGTELGVELIAGTPNPVRVRRVDTGTADTLPALFMPSAGTPGAAARLIAPPQVYAPDRALLIYVGEREVPIRCSTLIEQAPGFDCFEFTSGV
jgi:hypothetical protein